MARTAGSPASWAALLGLGALALGQPWGCDPGTTDEGDDDPLGLSGALAAVGPEVVLPALARFRAEVAGLDLALATWESAGDLESQAAAQAAWRDTMAVWQELEVMQIGPAGSSLTAIAGADVRDAIYSWPSVNPCRVDQETVEAAWGDADFFTVNLVNTYGLDAVEHLLWAGPDNVCPPQVDINASGSWDALEDAEITARRAAYARAVVAEIDRRAAELEAAWSPDGGDFSAALVADSDTSPYTSQQEALNAVFDALFYLETSTKDRKLAQPLGLVECAEARCPDDVEGLVSGSGAAAIAANLRGFRALFTGGDAAGMDDLLVGLGHTDLADEILADLDAALALADALTLPLDEAIEADAARVEALHAAVKAVTDDLKGDVVTVLALTVPSEAAGDND